MRSGYTGGPSWQAAGVAGMRRSGTSVRLLALLMVLAAPGMAGCGQKGPLYLPDEGEKETQDTALPHHRQVLPGGAP